MLKGKSIYHCSGSDKGKKYRTYKSRKKALAAHRAIMASKARRKKNKYTEALKHA